MKVFAPIVALVATLASPAFGEDFGIGVDQVIPVRLTQTGPTTVEAEPMITETAPAPLAEWDLKDVDPLPVHREGIAYPVISIQLGFPQIVSSSVGVIIGRVVYDASGKTARVLAAGALLQLEGGLGGIKASVGAAVARTLDLPRGTLSVPELATLMGAAVKFSVLHTWGYAATIDSNASYGIRELRGGETYVGGELSLAYVVKLSLGMLYGVSDGARGDRLFTLSMGWGF